MKKCVVFAMIIMICGVAYADPYQTEELDDDECTIQRVMEIPNDSGELKGCFVNNDTAFCSIWGGLSGWEARDMWSNITILKNKGIKKVNLYVNSGGGSAFSGMSIADTLRMAHNDGMIINTFASGLIASAAVPIFLAGGNRTASESTTFMIHRGKIFKMFSSESLEDLDAQKRMMELTEKQYIDFVAKRTNLTSEEIEDKLDKTTWFSAEQAKEWGFVDVIK